MPPGNAANRPEVAAPAPAAKPRAKRVKKPAFTQPAIPPITAEPTTAELVTPVPDKPVTDATAQQLINMLAVDDGQPPPPNPVIEKLNSIVDALAKGENIAPYREFIERICSNLAEKNDLIKALLQQADHEALVKYISMRASGLHASELYAKRNKLTQIEALTFMKCGSDGIATLRACLNDGKPMDATGTIGKIDYHSQQSQRATEKRWEGTTPQGRELIRKHLWKVERELKMAQGIMPMSIPPPEPPADEPVDSVLEQTSEVPPVTLARHG